VTPVSPIETYRAEPLVVGYLGRRDDEALLAAYSAAGVKLREVAASEWFGLATTRFGVEVVRRQRFWCWGRHVTDRRRPRNRMEAAHDLALAGLWVIGGRVELHTDVFGLNDVFLRTIGDVTYFSNRLHPLIALGGPLDIDWDAWGASLVFGGFVGRSTGFLEISRLGYGEVLTHDGETARIVRELPQWLTENRARSAEVEDVLTAFRAALPVRRGRRRPSVTLSGGWDSRLIAMALRDKGWRKISAWTVDPDTGFRDDVEYAKAVARALDLPHTVIHPPRRAWLDARSSLLARLQHQTWIHTWLSPLATTFSSTNLTVLDGLGGDLLLRNRFITDEMLSGPWNADANALLLRELGSGRLHHGWLLPEIIERWRRHVADELVPPDDAFAGHPSEPLLRALTLRTNRVIGAAPLHMFAPETRVLLPFMTPSVVQVTIAVPLHVKQGNGFYRAVLSALNPQVAVLPSTNDGPPSLPTGRPRRQASRGAIFSMREQMLECSQLRGVLAPGFLALLNEPPDRAKLEPHLVFLQWGSAFADWCVTHRNVLNSTDLPHLDSRRGLEPARLQ